MALEGVAAGVAHEGLLRPAPPTDADVDEMLAGTRLIDTGHGASLDLAGIRDRVRRVGRPAGALPAIAEIDVDPLVVTTERTPAPDVRVRIVPVPE